MLVIEIADVIRVCLGEATVAALPRRFGSQGTCPACRSPFGTAPLSVRAYDDSAGTVALVAYHASCAGSAWVHSAPPALPCRTAVAAMDTVTLRIRARRFLRPRAPGVRQVVMPVMLIRPCLEMTRIRPVGTGDAVSADVEEYYRLGFSDAGAFTTAYPVPAVGQARLLASGDAGSVTVSVHDRTWRAAAGGQSAQLIVARGGILVGVTCERDPVRLSADPDLLEAALGAGEVLLGWAPLSGAGRAGPGRGFRAQ